MRKQDLTEETGFEKMKKKKKVKPQCVPRIKDDQ